MTLFVVVAVVVQLVDCSIRLILNEQDWGIPGYKKYVLHELLKLLI